MNKLNIFVWIGVAGKKSEKSTRKMHGGKVYLFTLYIWL